MAKGQKEAKVLFTAEVSQFTKGITQINKSLSNLKSDLKACNADLKANGNSFETLTDKQNTLKNVIKQLNDRLENQEKCLKSAKETLGEGSEQYNKYYRAINNTKAELTKFQKELKDTERSLDSLNDEIDEVDEGSVGLGDGLKSLNKGFDLSTAGSVGLGTTLGNLASGALSWCIDKVSEFAQYLLSLPEATEEFRIQLAKLNGATTQYGYDVDKTKEKVKEMYGYFNDEQVAVNAITNLQGMGLSQEDLNSALDAGVAVWTAYGDSIPIESLTESINETSQVKKVTGSLADALNWAGISEDEFNKKLEKCKTTQESAKLITDTLNKAYGESKSKFDASTEGIRNNREATYNLKETESELAEEAQLVTQEMTELKNVLLSEVAPAFEGAGGKVQGLSESLQGLLNSNFWTVITTVGQGIIDIFEGITRTLGLVGNILAEFVEAACSLLTGDFSGALDHLQNGFIKTGTLVQDTGQVWIDSFSKASQSVQQDEIDMSIQAEKSFRRMQESASSSSKNAQTSVSTSTGNMKKDLQAVEDKNVTIQNPKTSTAEASLLNAVNRQKQNINSVGNLSPTIKSPKTSTAETAVGNMLSRMARNVGNFSPSWSIPKPKLPKVSVSTKSTSVGGITIPLPSFSVSWNAIGGIFTKPTIFNTRAGLQGVGEAGPEAILPLNSFYDHLDTAIAGVNNNIDYDRMTQSFINAMQTIDLQVVMNSAKVAECIAGDMDRTSGVRQSLYERGVNI